MSYTWVAFLFLSVSEYEILIYSDLLFIYFRMREYPVQSNLTKQCHPNLLDQNVGSTSDSE